ncbi:Polygalacturonase 1 [Ancistrocladus abbreviatus]
MFLRLLVIVSFVLISSSPSCVSSFPPNTTVINVEDFLVKSRHHTDQTYAFKKAWEDVCSVENGVIVVPRDNKYTLKPITFSGPCYAGITFKIDGTLEASKDQSDYQRNLKRWIVFDKVSDLKVEGEGTVDGNGQVWWPNSCKVDKHKAMLFHKCKKLEVDNLTIRNAQQMHVVFHRCNHVVASNLKISSPGDSPNTDGIHVTGTQDIHIMNSTIQTGDDCISIVSGSRNVNAMDITCGPGHGISIGSLGKRHRRAYVSDVMVNSANFSGTDNGVRIKTWQGGSGVAKNIVFQNIVMKDVSNPIIIDQNYCDRKTPCKQQRAAVRISNVTYSNIKGTSHTETAIKLDCSKSFPCRGIFLQDVNLAREGGRRAEADCRHVSKLEHIGSVAPRCTLSG